MKGTRLKHPPYAIPKWFQLAFQKMRSDDAERTNFKGVFLLTTDGKCKMIDFKFRNHMTNKNEIAKANYHDHCYFTRPGQVNLHQLLIRRG